MPVAVRPTSCLRRWTPPRDNEMVLREIQEIREALEAFNAAVETGEVTGFKDDALRAD